VLRLLESSYSEKNTASWFSFLQIDLQDLLAMLEQLSDQAGLQEVLDVEFYLLKHISVFSNDNLINYLIVT
jgi:hypothetical protein